MNIDEAIAELRERNEEVPTPARLPTEQEVNAIEAQLRVQFHPDYRKFVLQASDVTLGALEPATITDLEAHTYLPDICESAWDEMELPRKLLPICEDNGDYYCMDKTGKVIFWSDGQTQETWKDLATWIEEVWIGENAE